jgi:glycosyltransferase involved in cell wall biosynthesis
MHDDLNTSDKISIALATYNGEKYLYQLLTSLQAQTLKPFELVVIDDCSSDNSVKIVNDYSFSFGKKIFVNEKNMGPVYTFKKLAGLCKGDFIAFCDQDDVWISNKLELMFTEIKKLDQNVPAVVFSDLSVIDEEGKLIQQSYWQQRTVQPDKFSFQDILFANIITGCTTLINTAMANELSKMPLNVMMHDHWIALIAFSFGTHSFIEAPTVLFRSHNSSVTNKEKTTTINVFLNDLKLRKQYLCGNINQAIEFKNLYSQNLDGRDANVLDKFIALQTKPFFYKRFMRDKRSLLRRLK